MPVPFSLDQLDKSLSGLVCFIVFKKSPYISLILIKIIKNIIKIKFLKLKHNTSFFHKYLNDYEV